MGILKGNDGSHPLRSFSKSGLIYFREPTLILRVELAVLKNTISKLCDFFECVPLSLCTMRYCVVGATHLILKKIYSNTFIQILVHRNTKKIIYTKHTFERNTEICHRVASICVPSYDFLSGTRSERHEIWNAVY